MARTVIVGDLHGCREELERLLEKIAWSEADRVYFVGDLASRGPDPLGTLDWVRKTGACAVLGNHEDLLLRWRAAHKGLAPRPKLGRSQRALVDRLRESDWALLEGLPGFIDLPEHEVRVVHAGVLPRVPIETQPRQVLVNIRYLGRNGEPLETRSPKSHAVLWGARYQGPPHVVFGHYAQPTPQIHAWATGVDTGAVYGNRLTAMVLDEGQKVPPPDSRASVLVSVVSAKSYYVPRPR